MTNEINIITANSMFAPLMPASWNDGDYATINSSDIRRPWQSVYGFATAAAQLAVNQKLILHSREDEIFTLMTQLNDLLGRPEVLNHAHQLLKTLQIETSEKLARLIEIEEQPISEDEARELLEHIEQLFEESRQKSLTERFGSAITPDRPTEEIAGLRLMATRLHVLISALKEVKDQGFHVVVLDRRRQPDRPALESRRYELADGQAAGALQPLKYHLTLWAYMIVRSDKGQSTIWN